MADGYSAAHSGAIELFASKGYCQRMWQLIETAPKDGTYIDVWVETADGADGWRTVDAFWRGNALGYPDGAFCHYEDHETLAVVEGGGYFITHWMKVDAPQTAVPVASTHPVPV